MKGTVRYVDTGAQGSTLLMALKLDQQGKDGLTTDEHLRWVW